MPVVGGASTRNRAIHDVDVLIVHDADVGSRMERAGAQSVDRALSLLLTVARLGGADVSMSALLAETGISRPTVRRLMLALIRAGLVEQDASARTYALGAESYMIGLVAQRRFNLLDIAMDSLLALSADSGDSSFLTLRRGNHTVCLHREEGSYPIRTQALQPGDRHPVGIGAAGMAILAALPDDTCALMRQGIEEELRDNYPSYTPAMLDEVIRHAREQGWALNPGLNLANSWGMGIALKDPSGEIIGALSIAALDTRMQADRQAVLARLLEREARRIEQRLDEQLNLPQAG